MQILCFFLFLFKGSSISVVFSTLLSCSGFIMCSLFASCIFIWTNKDDDDDIEINGNTMSFSTYTGSYMQGPK